MTGDNWTANDLLKFQHGSIDECSLDEQRGICEEWLRRLNAIPKKYCYLTWHASGIYTCYYRLAPLIGDKVEKRELWTNVKREYAEIFMMGRRIWRRPTHPNRLRILYDLAMLCVRFNDIPNDDTVVLFRDLLDDYDNFNFEVLNEIEYAESIEKTVRLENHVIDLFYQRNKASGSARSSFVSRTSSDTPRGSFRVRAEARTDDVSKKTTSADDSGKTDDEICKLSIKIQNHSMLGSDFDEAAMILNSSCEQVDALDAAKMTRNLSVRFAPKKLSVSSMTSNQLAVDQVAGDDGRRKRSDAGLGEPTADNGRKRSAISVNDTVLCKVREHSSSSFTIVAKFVTSLALAHSILNCKFELRKQAETAKTSRLMRIVAAKRCRWNGC